MPTSTELAKHPYVRITVWDYDEGGSSDDLGVGKFYLHNITGASRIHHAEAENSEDASMDDFKPNAPRKRTVMVSTAAAWQQIHQQIPLRFFGGFSLSLSLFLHVFIYLG